MNTEFQRRCASALTHPVTLAALSCVSSRNSLRVYLVMLIAGVAALSGGAIVSSSGPPEPRRLVGQIDDGTLVLGIWDPYISSDGGLTWRSVHWYSVGHSVRFPYDEEWSEDYVEVEWGDEQAETPRGTYAIEDRRIIRITGGLIGVELPDQTYKFRFDREENRLVLVTDETREVIYSPPYLRNEVHVRFEEFTARRDGCFWGCSPYPISIVYHAPTGNVVASMGTHGIIVVDSTGNWKHVTVDQQFRPMDFSTTNQIRSVFNRGGIWWTATALAIAATATALALSQLITSIESLFGCLFTLLVPASVLILAALAFALLIDGYSTAFVVVSFIVLLATGALWLKNPRAMGLGSSVCAVIASTLALKALYSGTVDDYSMIYDADTLMSFIGVLVGIVLGLVALVTFRPSLHQLPVVVAALLGMIMLIVLAFFIDIVQGFDLSAGKLYAFIFVLMAAFALWCILDAGSEPISKSPALPPVRRTPRRRCRADSGTRNPSLGPGSGPV